MIKQKGNFPNLKKKIVKKNSDLKTFLVLAYSPHANRKLLLHKLLCICNRFNWHICLMINYLYNTIICIIHLELFFLLCFHTHSCYYSLVLRTRPKQNNMTETLQWWQSVIELQKTHRLCRAHKDWWRYSFQLLTR